MVLAVAYGQRWDDLDEDLRRAQAPSAAFFPRVTAGACGDPPRWIGRLIEAGAFTEAGLLLIELEVPAWTIRRLICEGGEWLCTLSRCPRLPLSLDDVAEATHPVLPLALLRALVEVRRRSVTAPPSLSPRVVPVPERVLYCDNFA